MDLSFFLPFELLPWQWAAWITLGIFIGMTKAGLSGLTSVIVPIIAMIFGARNSTGLILPLLCIADVIAVLYYRRHAEWKYIVRLLPWTLAGFGLAIFIDRLVPVQAFRYLIGGSIIASVIVMIWSDLRMRDKAPPSAWWFSALFGLAGGFATLVGNVAGPIMAVFLLSMRLPKNNYIGTSAQFFMIVNLLKLPIMIFLWKNITLEGFLFDLTLVPVILFGAVFGIFIVKKIPEKVFRKVIMILTLVSTVLLFI